jgi:GDP-D-mannose 3', 5'-epimerase
VKAALVLGAGGFIGCHLVKRLKHEGFWVRGVDVSLPQFGSTPADDFLLGDLRQLECCRDAIDRKFDETYQLAADMGGAGYLFTGENDANVMHNSGLINLNVIDACLRQSCKRIFFSSSACIYPEYNQMDTSNPRTEEGSAYPAAPDSEYGWEKLYSERLYLAFHRNYGLEVRIGRYHNIFGPEGAWNNGREKAPAALCRKVAEAPDGDEIAIWGDGKQTRSFLYIDECLEATTRLMRSDWTGPVNIGSEELVSINRLAEMIMEIACKRLEIRNTEGPVGVRGRTSDNALIARHLGWRPTMPLVHGLRETYEWVRRQVELAMAPSVRV